MLEKISDFITSILKDFQHLTFIVGVLLIFISAVDVLEIREFNLDVNDPIGRILLAAIGALIISSAIGILPSAKRKPMPVDLGIKILGENPIGGVLKRIPGEGFNTAEIKVSGEIKAPLPPDKSIWLFHAHYGRETLYYPQREVTVSKDAQSWNGTVIIGGERAKHSKAMVAVVGKTGNFLCNYYWQVNQQTKSYIGFAELPPDIEKYDEKDIKII